VVARASDRDDAESTVADLYLPNRLLLPPSASQLDMTLAALRIDDLTIGRLGYGLDVRLVTDDARQVHVNVPLAGRAMSTPGCSDQVLTAPGTAAVFAPHEPADILWSADCVQLCLMVPRATLEAELEEILGRPVTRALRFDPLMDLSSSVARSWRAALQLVVGEFDDGPGLAAHPRGGRHLRRLLLDGLLLGHSHNYTDALAAPRPADSGSAVARAVDLVNDAPERPWSTTSLARAVHLSVRALQEGFHREVGRPPMTYLRDVRLRRAHEALRSAAPGSTTVEAVALRYGLVHLGRFAATYRGTFGETPSTTLRHDP
jgi:AraC-like DNA-binding protein